MSATAVVRCTATSDIPTTDHAVAAAATSAPDRVAAVQAILVGRKVRLHGLLNDTDFNGREGMVCLHERRGYLAVDVAHGFGTKLLRPENLVVFDSRAIAGGDAVVKSDVLIPRSDEVVTELVAVVDQVVTAEKAEAEKKLEAVEEFAQILWRAGEQSGGGDGRHEVS